MCFPLKARNLLTSRRMMMTNKQSRYLAIDIGGTYIKSAFLDEEGRIIERYSSISTPYDKKQYIDTIFEIVEQTKEKPAGVAVSTSGIIDNDTGTYLQSGSFPFMISENLKDLIESKYNLTASVVNDGQAALYGEMWKGKLRKQRNALLVTIGTGIVGGLLINGQPYLGAHGMAGELSSITQDEKEGYFPVKYSSTHFIERASQIIGLDEPDGQEVFRNLYQGKQDLDQLFTDYCYLVSLLLFNLQVTLDPELIVISGGISNQEIFIEELRKQCDIIYKNKSEAYLGPGHLKITASAFRSDANLLGALYFYKTKYESE